MRRTYHGFILFLVILNLYSLILLSCSKNGTESNDNTITVSGKVTLEGQGDHSGVTVRLYKPVTLDTALVRINQQYPNIGVQISQETEFDHRGETASYSTTTNANGDWNIENVVDGEYNLVASKDGYGWQYRYAVKGGSFTFNLSPTVLQNGILTGSIVWESGKTYVLEGDVYVDAAATLTIQENVWCLAKQNSRLIVEGKIIKSATGFSYFTNDISNSGTWRGIVLNSSNNAFNGIIIDKASNAIRSDNTSNSIENTIIRNATGIGIGLSQNISQVLIDNVLLLNNQVGLEISGADSTNQITNSVITGSIQQGIQLTQSNILIRNNLIRNNSLGISCLFESQAIIQNNNIQENLTDGIEVSGSKPEIMYNNIISNDRMAINITARGYTVPAQPVIHNNNLSTKSDFIIKLIGTSASPNNLDISAENNWWSTTDVVNINNMIYDKNDVDPSDMIRYPYTGYIFYSPILMSAEPSAGITN